MGTLADGVTDAIPGTAIPRGLATSAVVRCNDLLVELLRQVVVDGGPGTRRSGFGLYELMHAVEDSFSLSHAQRAPAGIDYLRVWKPIEKIARIPTERSSKVPDEVFHAWDDHRDKTYVLEGGTEECEKRVDQPYDVPYACLSPEGDGARRALVELLVLVRDLRAAQLAAPAGTDSHPESSPAWRAYRARWFTPVHPCEGAECEVRQPPERVPGKYAFLGADTRFVSPGTFEVAALGSVLRFSEELNPFVYGVSASLGYQYSRDGGNAGIVGLGVGLFLPLGLKASLGLTPAELRIVYGGSSGGVEMLTRLLRLDYEVADKVVLSVEAPMVVNWVEPAVHWSVGVGVSYGLFAPRVVEGDTLLHHEDQVERQDGEWVPPPAPYGRLQGRRTTVALITGISTTTAPADEAPGRVYGLGMIGAELTWDRDAWRGRFALTPVVSLAAGLRNTSGLSTYATATLGAGLRWYFLGPLGLSVTAARLEVGPKVRGKGEADASEGVHGAPGDEYYLLAGSRAGLVLRLGVLDLLVESPTIAWTSEPFGAHEIVSFTLGIRL
jgi:hypothetical protein